MLAQRALGMCCILLSITATASAADTQVRGNISLAGEPLKSGKLTLYLQNGEFVGTAVNNGRYSFSKVQVPTGTFSATIEGEGVPAKYGHQNATPLRIEIKAGENQFDFVLAR